MCRMTVRLAALALLVAATTALAAPPRTLPDGKLPNDVRLQPPKDLDGYFPLSVPKDRTCRTPPISPV